MRVPCTFGIMYREKYPMEFRTRKTVAENDCFECCKLPCGTSGRFV